MDSVALKKVAMVEAKRFSDSVSLSDLIRS